MSFFVYSGDINGSAKFLDSDDSHRWENLVAVFRLAIDNFSMILFNFSDSISSIVVVFHPCFFIRYDFAFDELQCERIAGIHLSGMYLLSM